MNIWKYNFVIGEFEKEMPSGAEILCVQVQHEKPAMWAKVDPEASKETRKFQVCETGHLIEGDDLKYIGTFQMNGGFFIGHLFEVV